MNDEPLFVKVEKPGRGPITNPKWNDLIEALGGGDAFRIPLKQASVQTVIGRGAMVRYPGKRVTTRKVDDSHTIVWLVDR